MNESASPGAAQPSEGPAAGGPPGEREAFVPVGPHIYRLHTPLTLATVPTLRGPGLTLIRSVADELTLELVQLPAVDSAGLALLIDWLAAARAQGRTLRYTAAPDSLRALARLSDVEQLFQE